MPRVGFPDPGRSPRATALLGDWLAGLSAATGLPPEPIVLGGFSQGAVMALALALGAGRPTPAAVVALSGFVPTVEGWTADVQRPGLPAFVTHGRRDPVIPVSSAGRPATCSSPPPST